MVSEKFSKSFSKVFLKFFERIGNFAYQKERCLRQSRFLNKPLYEEVEAHASTGAGRNYRSNASPIFFSRRRLHRYTPGEFET